MDLRALYQEMIIDHNRNPRHFHVMAHPTSEAQGFNRLCGDKLTVYLKLKADCIEDISFMGSGCAISQASASLMTEALQGKTIKEARRLFNAFHCMLTQETCPCETMEKLTALAGVRAYPARVKCATLAWHTLEAALKKESQVVSTE